MRIIKTDIRLNENEFAHVVYGEFQGEEQILFQGTKQECKKYIKDHLKETDAHKWLVEVILPLAKENKQKQFLNALYRNQYLTSTFNLSSCKIEKYVQGTYLTFEGTRCQATLYIDNNYNVLPRKPNKNKLTFLHYMFETIEEGDFNFFTK